jgi:predicted amidohydrolase
MQNFNQATRIVTLFLFVILLIIPIADLRSQDTDTLKILKIATSQFPVSSDIEANAVWIKRHMSQAKTQNANLVHFPECALSGYAGVDFNSLDELDWPQLQKHTQTILDLADELDLYVLLGSTHRLSKENKPHNSLYLIGPEGTILDRYDKRFCTNGDLKYYTPGDHFVEFEIKDVRCGLLICYDVRFPELYRQYSKKNMQVLFQSFYNARQKPGGIHPKIMPVTAQAHAGSNYLFMSLSNSSAPNSWPCHFITPDGLIEEKLPANKPGLLISEIDISKEYYDASKPHRPDAIDGKLNSGETVDDERSKNRTAF